MSDVQKIIRIYDEFSGTGIFASIYNRLKEEKVNGELCIVIGIKDGHVYGSANVFENSEPWEEIPGAVETFVRKMRQARLKTNPKD